MLFIEHLTKRYPGTVALCDVSMTLLPGKVNGIVGHNGAGKSTLVKILSGIIRQDEGNVFIKEKDQRLDVTSNLAVVHQYTQLCSNLTVAENFALVMKHNYGFVNRSSAGQLANKELSKLGVQIDPNTLVEDLSVADKQLVSIAQSLYQSSSILILDEPTASLGPNETERLFKVINDLKDSGTLIVFISHRLSEVFEICDNVTVLKEGRVVKTKEISDVTEKALIEYMTGQKFEMDNGELLSKNQADKKRASIDVKIMDRKTEILHLQFQAGCVHGMLGLPGSGVEDLIKSFSGTSRKYTAKISTGNKEEQSGIKAIGDSVGVVPRDRLNSGVFVYLSILDNISTGVVQGNKDQGFFRNFKDEIKNASDIIKSLNVRTSSYNQEVEELSGGNQQKVAIGKTIGLKSPLVIFDEPTVGVDVQSKKEVYGIIRKLASEGKCVLVVSQDTEELVQVCEHILVVHKGKVVGDFSPPYDQNNILLAACSGL